MVMVGSACPSWSAMDASGMPASWSRVATVRRNVWGIAQGKPASSRTLADPVGEIGGVDRHIRPWVGELAVGQFHLERAAHREHVGLVALPGRHAAAPAEQPIGEPVGQVVHPVRPSGLGAPDAHALLGEVHIVPRNHSGLADTASGAGHERHQVGGELPLADGAWVGRLFHFAICHVEDRVPFGTGEGATAVASSVRGSRRSEAP